MKTLKLVSDFSVNKNLTDDSYIYIEGYANTTTKDRMGDIIQEEAWNKGGLSNFKKNPVILAYHNHSRPIGLATELSVDPHGLKITAKISKKISEISDLISEGILKAFSVGFRLKEADYDSTTDTFFITDLELLEVSVVSVPANADSVFQLKKAFETDEAFDEYKKSFIKEPESTETAIVETVETEEKENDLSSKVDAIIETLNTVVGVINQNSSTKETDEETVEVEDKEKEKNMTVEITKEGVEQLVADAEKRFADETATLKSVIEELGASLKEKNEEVQALLKSKMSFKDKENVDKSTEKDRDHAVLLGMIMGKSLDKTKFGQSVIEKSGRQHWESGADGGWEEEFSTRVYNDMRLRLVVEPLIRNKINMNAPTMHIPINPEAGTGYWIPTGDFNANTSSSTTAGVHKLDDNTLVAYKLASKEFLGYEEEEDSIVPLLPIVNDAIVRRMARSSDIAILRGTGTGSAQPTYDPISGLTTLAVAASATETYQGTAKVTIAKLAAVRKKLGSWGLNPSDLVYVVSQDAYYDLLDDSDFRTMDVVGNHATILNGQIGAINGSPVIVSGEFAAKANNVPAAVCVNVSNFLLGELRGLRIQREDKIEQQQNLIVATRRVAFKSIIANKGVASLIYNT